MPLYKVRVELVQSGTIYVEADTPEAAEEDALGLMSEGSFDTWEDRVDTPELIDEVPTGVQYWTGGPNGKWA